MQVFDWFLWLGVGVAIAGLLGGSSPAIIIGGILAFTGAIGEIIRIFLMVNYGWP